MHPNSGLLRVRTAIALILAALLPAVSTGPARASHEVIVVDGDLTDLILAVNNNAGSAFGGFSSPDPSGDIHGTSCGYVNGYDMRQLYLFLDFKDSSGNMKPGDVTLYAGWDMEGIVGDVDGNGHPDTFDPGGPGGTSGCAFTEDAGIGPNEEYALLIDVDCAGAIDDISIRIRGNTVTRVVDGVSTPIPGATFGFSDDKLELMVPDYQDLVADVSGADLCSARFWFTANAQFDGLGEDISSPSQLEVPPLISAQKRPGSQDVVAGNEISWMITVVNDGLCILNSVSVLDALVADLTYVTATPAPVVNGQQLTWDFPGIDLDPGQTIQIDLTARTSSSCGGSPLDNFVTATGTHGSGCSAPQVTGAQAVATVSVQCPAPPNCRFADSVVGFSSEFSPDAWGAVQALGPPDVYPAHGDIVYAWAPAKPDGGLEFLELGFADPAPINFVNVYETYSPGTITTIQAFNPNSGLYETVWTAIATAAPLVSRIYTAIFPETPFPVSRVLIEFDCAAVPDWNEIDAVAIGKCDRDFGSQWATSVLGFSSEYSALGWSAQEALGPPNTYPTYGDISTAWASETADGQPEYLVLGFSNPTPINVVRVVETLGPGTLNRVSVKNPGTGQFEEVWQGSAAPAPEVARILEVSFPETSFPVSEVWLDFDSPAVPGWNEIDAVAIARCDCPTIVSEVPPPVEAPGISTVEELGPNPFSRSTGIRFSLARGGAVSIDVFNLSGQRIATIVDGPLPAGRHEYQWDGRDAAGRDVASGIYYLHLESREMRRSLKVVKVR